MTKIIDESCCILCGHSKGNFNGQVCCDNRCDSIYYKDLLHKSDLLSDRFIEESKEIMERRFREINRKIEDHSKDYAELEFNMLLRMYNYLSKKDKTLWQVKAIFARLEEINYNFGLHLNKIEELKKAEEKKTEKKE